MRQPGLHVPAAHSNQPGRPQHVSIDLLDYCIRLFSETPFFVHLFVAHIHRRFLGNSVLCTPFCCSHSGPAPCLAHWRLCWHIARRFGMHPAKPPSSQIRPLTKYSFVGPLFQRQHDQRVVDICDSAGFGFCTSRCLHGEASGTLSTCTNTCRHVPMHACNAHMSVAIPTCFSPFLFVSLATQVVYMTASSM